MISVAFDARMYRPSGIGTYIRNLLCEYVNIPDNFIFSVIGNETKLKELIGESKKFKIRNINCPIYSISEHFNIPRLAKGADILHIPHYNVPIFWHGKLVVSVMDMLYWDHPEFISSKVGKFYLNIISRKLRKADCIICPSEFTASRVIENLNMPAKKVCVVYLSADFNHFTSRTNNATKDIIAKYNLELKRYLLFVSNMKPHKNLQRIIKAFLIAKEKGVKDKLVLIGSSKNLRAVENMKKLIHNGDIIYIENVNYEELPYLYCGAKAFIFPSLYEGFGIPPLEAMSCKCPVLTSNEASLPEVVGDAALIVDAYDIESIAKGIIKISDDTELRKSLINKGRERIKQFSWEKTAIQTLEIYKKLRQNNVTQEI
jgi:glycosyltransferase involved in cell wall biosynthesis